MDVELEDELEAEDDNQELEVWGWENFFQNISAFILYLMRQYGTANESYSHYAVERLTLCVRSVSDVREHLRRQTFEMGTVDVSEEERSVVIRYVQKLGQLIDNLRRIGLLWEAHIDMADQRNESTAYRAPVIDLPRGRPHFDITRYQLEYLSSLGFNWVQIAHLLQVSRMTVYRRRVEFDMLSDGSERLTRDEIGRHVTQMRQQFPNIGESMVIGRFCAMGFRVAREDVRQAIRETDPLNTALRWPGGLTGRRPYSVPGPNSLWHIGKN